MSTQPTVPPAISSVPPALLPGGRTPSPRATIPAIIPLDFSTGKVEGADRIVIYGPGGIGKSTLGMYLPGALFIDLEAGTRKLQVTRDSTVKDWSTLRGKLAGIASAPPKGMQTVIIDSVTVAEVMAKEHVIATRKTEKGHYVDSIEGFGWNRGLNYVYEEFVGLVADLDRLLDVGINVCLICHEVTSFAPNPDGDEYLRWDLHLYAGDKKQRGSIRDRVEQWADHILFIGYDVAVKDGKGQGCGTRTIYSAETPTHIAKSRTWRGSMPYDLQDPAAIWRALELLPQTPNSNPTQQPQPQL